MLDALDDGFGVLAADGRVTYWNPAAERLLGVPRARLLGRPVETRIPALAVSPGREALADAAGGRRSARFLLPATPDLACSHLWVQVAPLPDGGVVLQIRDASEEVERAEQHAALLESIRDGFVAVDARWNIVYLNATGEALLRLPREKAVGTSLWALLPRGPAEIAEVLRATMSDGIQRHLRRVCPEGRVFRGRVFDLWTHPLAGGGISVLFEDVSERVQHERELARLAAAAQEANQAKSRFFAAVSHELRTPLNAIVGYTHLLHTRAYGELPEGAVRAAERSGVCAEHLARLVDDVLLMTTAEIGRLPVVAAEVDLDAFLPSVMEHHRHQAEAKGLDFVLDVPPDLPLLETDPQRLRQLLAALVSNAIKFTPRGEVRIEVRCREDHEPSQSGANAAYSLFPERRLEIAVVDTGPGIPPDEHERIFWPFEQVGHAARSDSMRRGSGLGLTIARQLAQLLSGTLTLSSHPGDGSRFVLRFPIALPHPAE